MRPVRRRKVIGGMQWRRQVAPALALLALLAFQALLPAFHFAAGRPLVPVPTPASHDLPVADHHHGGHGRDDGSSSGSAEHQACHFCRLIGVALPPPPSDVIALVSAPKALRIVADRPLRPRQRFEARPPARAPPPIA